jgi:hypothetical protein
MASEEGLRFRELVIKPVSVYEYIAVHGSLSFFLPLAPTLNYRADFSVS